MNRKILSDIEPKNVMRFFEALSAVPRGSGKTAAATAFCVGFAKQRGLRQQAMLSFTKAAPRDVKTKLP